MNDRGWTLLVGIWIGVLIMGLAIVVSEWGARDMPVVGL